MQTDEIEKLYFTMGEVSEKLNVAPSLLRFWEKEFDCLKPHKNKKGNRLYTKQDIQNLQLIYHLVKDKGYTLSGANDKINGDRKVLNKNFAIHQSLTKLKSFLEEMKSDLD